MSDALKLSVILWMVVPSLLEADDAKIQKPNIVFFLIDDLGSSDCGFNGGKENQDTEHRQTGERRSGFRVALCSAGLFANSRCLDDRAICDSDGRLHHRAPEGEMGIALG